MNQPANQPLGKAYLVGAGPGSPDLLTRRAHHLLTHAQTLLYDALIDPRLLALAPADCQQICVGKRGGQPSLTQPEIDRILVEQCQQGRDVIRIKSGDPFIFGRTTSEIQALKAAGCDFEVVPGLSSALVAPLLASIPLTDLALSRSFTVLSAHEPATLDWATLARLDTLVILMGARALPEIVQQLQARGKSGETPIGIIRWAGQPQEQVWIGTLTTILSQIGGESLSPCIIVIGAVVGMRAYLQPDRQLPLSGKTVLVTRSATQADTFSNLLQAQGAATVEMPTLEILPPGDWQGLDQAIAEITKFDWLILTSANAVNYFFERLAHHGKDARALGNTKIAVVGDKTAQWLNQRGLKPDFTPPDFVADALVQHFPADPQGLNMLFPRVETGGRELLVQAFTERGASVTEVAAYQSACPAQIDPAALSALQTGAIDLITFTSAKTVQHFCQLVEAAMGPDFPACLNGVTLASIGPQTSKACQNRLGRVDIEATEYTLDGLTEAILDWTADGSNANLKARQSKISQEEA
jgi:uroporphyrinogen III methyltransferase / synthase